MQLTHLRHVPVVAASASRPIGVSPSARWSRLAIMLVFAALLLPRGVELQLGTIMINPLRVILTWFGLGALCKVLSRAIRLTVTPADWLMGLHIGVIVLSAFVHGGFDEGLENAIASTIDMGLAYFVTRVAVHDLVSYHYFVRAALIIAAISGVFGAVEMVSGYSPIRGLFVPLFPQVPYVYLENQRLSLYRATATFPADILFGLYCMLAFGLAVNIGAKRLGMRRGVYMTCMVLSLLGLFSSLSSAPWLALTLVLCMMAYDWFFRTERNRWSLLIVGAIGVWLVLGMISNRGPVKLIVNYLTLNPESGYIRMAMLECVWALVPDYWSLGWGWGNDWPRSVEWYKWNSIDCFYAVLFVHSGVFAVITLLAWAGYCWYRMGKIARRVPAVSNEIKSWIMTTVAFFFAVITVDVFGNFVIPIYAMLGAGQILMAPSISTRRHS